METQLLAIEQSIARKLAETYKSASAAFLAVDLHRDAIVDADELYVACMHLGIPISQGLAHATLVHHGHATPTGPTMDPAAFARFFELWQAPGGRHGEVSTEISDTAALAAYPYPEAEHPHAAVAQTPAEHGTAVATAVRAQLHAHLHDKAPAPVAQLFLALDSQRSGELTFGEVSYGLARLGLSLQSSEVVALLAPFDRTRRGVVKLADFYRILFPEETAAALVAEMEAHHAAEELQRADIIRRWAEAEAARPHVPRVPVQLKLDDNLADAVIIGKVAHILERDRLNLHTVFYGLDTAGTGDLSVAEFQEGLARMGIAISPERVAALLAHYGAGPDRIHYWQLVRMVSSTLADLYDEEIATADVAVPASLYSAVGAVSAAVLGGSRRLRAAFDSMDRDHDRLLTPAELYKGLRTLGVEVSEQDATRLVATFGSPLEGKLHFSQFVKMIGAAGTKP